MFKIEKEPKFWVEVIVLVPVDDGHCEETFRARFRVQPADIVEQYDLRVSGGEIAEFLRETIVDLDDITDENGQTLPYTDKLLETMLANYGARLALWNTYIGAVTKARLGN